MLLESLSDFLKQRLPPANAARHFCVALSGGLDSVVLLHALQHLQGAGCLAGRISAIHVHHGLSQNADSWGDFCVNFCQALKIPLHIARVRVAQNSGEGPEAAARHARYEAFVAVAESLGQGAPVYLLLAHHRDDLSETVLLNLLRGAGLAGAAGMSAERQLSGNILLLRPFLNCPRTALEAYAAEHDLRWISDESNEDRHFRRNFLRHEIMPRLNERFPNASAALSRAAAHFAEGDLLLNELAAIDQAALLTPAGRVGLVGFNALSTARAHNLLRFLFAQAGFRAPDTRWMTEALQQLKTVKPASETCLSRADGQLRVYRGELYLRRHCLSVPVECVWQGEHFLPWGDGKVFLQATQGAGLRPSLMLAGQVFLRLRQGGEHLQIQAKRPRRSLRNLLQENAVPPWERTQLPLLWCGGELAWCGGLTQAYAVNLLCAPDEMGVTVIWQRD